MTTPKTLNTTTQHAALARQAVLTKPAGSLARLEDIAVRLASMQGTEQPRINAPWISIFAADHGVVAENISAFPQAVTGQMILNFAHGGAAISVLAKEIGATLEVVDVGSLLPECELPGVIWNKIAQGSANIAREPAMSEAQLDAALNAGQRAVQRALSAQADLFIGGEMGIGNTTSSSAMACALTQYRPTKLTGPGTGLDSAGIQHKIAVIEQALALHRSALSSPRQILRHLGGFEIAALTGAYLACASHGLPAVIDGIISSVAALCAERLMPGASAWWFYGHQSPEPAHAVILAALNAQPLLNLGLRLGEGSGAATAVPLLKLACALHNGMNTFAEAGVAEKS
ncbi:MAG: nicotinate-nucleotide--dimethylbenzimidazole phosphoribosyltransferase [Halothiobacillaceae bacterium]|nr:nicotinate-nucleotide--dimethylbenzimidazole phosphoribosyltransferase [Halothiobacillaceae bacterium]